LITFSNVSNFSTTAMEYMPLIKRSKYCIFQYQSSIITPELRNGYQLHSAEIKSPYIWRVNVNNKRCKRYSCSGIAFFDTRV